MKSSAQSLFVKHVSPLGASPVRVAHDVKRAPLLDGLSGVDFPWQAPPPSMARAY